MRPKLLDGGFATCLEARGFALGGPLWSARALRDAPEAVAWAHAAFASAGAQVISTGSYQLSREALRRAGWSPEDAPAWFRRSVELARSAAGEGIEVWLSLGPYGASLADRSEYHGRYGVSSAVLNEHWRERLDDAEASGADRWLIETVPSQAEAELIAELLTARGAPVPVALSFSVSAPGLDALEALARTLAGGPFVALGANCAPPGLVLNAAAQLRRGAPGLEILAYPNQAGGEAELVDFAARAALLGASAIGGCCGVGPELIRSIGARISEP